MSRRFLRHLGLAAAFVLLALGLAGPAAPASAVFDDRDHDGVPDFAEEIVGADPSNPRSTPETTGSEIISGDRPCSDGADNDLDGLVDGADPTCVDSDGDFVADPTEVVYGSDPNDLRSFPEDSRLDAILNYYGLSLTFCEDTVDNDRDGLTDRADPGCPVISDDGDRFDDVTEKRYGSDPGDPNSVPEHEAVNPRSCRDGVDNDLDGLIDAADPACTVPRNDDRAAATVIDAVPYAHGPLVIKNATVERGEPFASCLFGGGGGTVWYAFTAPADAVLIADTFGSNFSTTLAVWRQTGAGLQEVACSNTYFYPTHARAVFHAAAGATYLFQIDGFTYDVGQPALAFSLRAGTPPRNDDFQNAPAIADLPLTDTVDVSAATREQGEPTPFCGFEASSSVWYAFTPASDTLVVANTEGSSYDAVLAVWRRDAFGLTKVTCNNDFGNSLQAKVAVHARAGETYYFQVTRGLGLATEVYDLVLTIEAAVAPPNDDLGNAAPVAMLPFSSTVDTLTAGREPGEPRLSCVYELTGSTVWYRYTAPADQVVVADTEGTPASDTTIGVFVSSAPGDLAQVACAAYGYPYSQLGFQARAGETYYIQVGTVSFSQLPLDIAPPLPAGYPEAGVITLNLHELEVADCPPPRFTVADPWGDTLPQPPFVPEGGVHDITAVSGGRTGADYCLRLDFAGPVDPPGSAGGRAVFAVVDFDVDNNASTGYPSSADYNCAGRLAALGTETQIYMSESGGILIPLYIEIGPHLPGGVDDEALFAVALVEGRSLTLVIPLEAIGRDDIFDFALYVRGSDYSVHDCAPNGGHIRSPDPARPGDVTCDGRTNSVDAMIILRHFARLLAAVPCYYAGDVNGNGSLGPLDAVMVLQYEAGLLDALPPVPNSALEAVMRASGELVGLLRGQLQLVAKEPQQWPDSCLGLPREGEVCLEVITPGYAIVIETAPGSGAPYNRLVWRTNADGSDVRLEAHALG